MELLGLIRTAARSLRHDGFRPTVDLVVKNLVELWREWVNRRFDSKHDVDTSRRIELSDLDIDSPNRTFGVYYEPTPIKTLRRICAHLPRDPRDFVFVDFGSGKGRVLLIASEYNFKRVIGVEFAKDLHRIAQRNVQTYQSRSQRCFDVESRSAWTRRYFPSRRRSACFTFSTLSARRSCRE
ncbi:MAG: hypothetical protein ACREX4_15895 [Gammaproteobacteria bacterium]